jgi:squalene-hopene/tetraprenyl-beta-curcumene cyclase
MVPHDDGPRLAAAGRQARTELLSHRNAGGSWHGRLSYSPLATAAAVSALALAEQHVDDQPQDRSGKSDSWLSGVLFRTELNELVIESLRWLADRQNPDGGWGDAADAPSSLPASVMVLTAFQLTAVPARYAGMIERAEIFIEAAGGVEALRRTKSSDGGLSACVLAAAAAAGLASWRSVPTERFERFLAPSALRKRRSEVGDDWLTAPRLAAGLAKAMHAPSRNPLARLARRLARAEAVAALTAAQNQPGDFRQSALATALVVIGAASAGGGLEWVVRRGIEHLFAAVRGEGVWACRDNRAVVDTAEAALAVRWNLDSSECVDSRSEDQASEQPSAAAAATLNWLLSKRRNAGGEASGGWAVGDDLQSPIDACATASVVRALAAWHRRWPTMRSEEVLRAIEGGADFLAARLNRLAAPLRRDEAGAEASSPGACVDELGSASLALEAAQNVAPTGPIRPLSKPAWREAKEAAITLLLRIQHPDGAWDSRRILATEDNLGSRVWGTALAVDCLAQLGHSGGEAATRGASWLVGSQFEDGSWGRERREPVRPGVRKNGCTGGRTVGTLEETVCVLSALARVAEREPKWSEAVQRGATWLLEAVEHVETCSTSTPVLVDDGWPRCGDSVWRLVGLATTWEALADLAVRQTPVAARA